MKHLVTLIVLLLSVNLAVGQVVKPMSTCEVLRKLADEFPNNFAAYVGEEESIGFLEQADFKYNSLLTLPTTPKAIFYTELYKDDKIFFTRIYESNDTASARAIIRRWRKEIENCTFTFGSLAVVEYEDNLEYRLQFFPFELTTPELEKKWSRFVVELKLNKDLDTRGAQLVNIFAVELRVRKM